MIKKIILCALTTLLVDGVGMAKASQHTLPKEEEMGAYLMVYHKDCDHSLHMAISYDGYAWTALNNDRPIICGDTIAEQHGIRDPHIFRGPDGGFYLAMTDLHIFGSKAAAEREGHMNTKIYRNTEWERDGATYGWGNNRGLVLMKSFDLVNWTRTNLDFSKLPPQPGQDWSEVGCVWAPETVYDEEKGQLLVHFTTRTRKEQGAIYCVYMNDDFTQMIGQPQLLFEAPQRKYTVIDSDIIKVGDTYHLFFVSHEKGATPVHATSKCITGPYEIDTLYNDNEKGGHEAPNCWKRIGEDKYVLMFDNYSLRPHNFGFVETTDFRTFTPIGHFGEEGSPMKRANFSEQKHGAVIWITKEEAQRLEDLYMMPQMPAFPEIPAPEAVGSVPMGDSKSFAEVQLDIPIASGPYKPNWESIEQNYPGDPQWLRDAKFGIWVHFGPQAAGESGDWYARKLYYEGSGAYQNHLKRYGHPSEVGYKEVLRDWNPTKLDPEYLTKLYQKAGARFLMIQGVHHDNYDLWDSQYQPWNSVNIGPKRDILREWVDACHKYNMRYGVTFHHEYTWWWWQTAFASDSKGDKAGVPYDGNLTLDDGKGKWWEGYDPRLLYGINLREYKTVAERANDGWSPPNAGIFSRHLDYCKWYATQWALRMMDVTAHYDPDFIYTDGTVQGPFTGNGTGTGYKCNAMQTVMADYYNRVLKKRGKVDAFSIIKFRSPTNGAVNTAEFEFPDTINASQPWIREAPVGDWFYAPGFTYDSGSMIRFIIEAICRDGNAALNIPMRPDGSIEDACVTMLEEVGQWMQINGEAVYGSKAWRTLGEGEMVNGKLKKLPGGGLGKKHADFQFTPQDIRFTVGKDGSLYAFTMAVPEAGSRVTIHSLRKGQEKVKSVALLGCDSKLKWRQTSEGLVINCPDKPGLVTSLVFKIAIE